MDKEIKHALNRVGRLIIVTGGRLKRFSIRNRDPTLKELNDIHADLLYCAEAISQIVNAMNEENP